MSALKHFDLLGISISSVNMELAVSTLEGWIERKEPHYVCVCPVYTVMQGFCDTSLGKIINGAGMTTPDGMPVVWMAHLLGQSNVSRVYGPDLMLAFCELAQRKGYRHYFYGGAEGVAEGLSKSLLERFPELQIAGAFTPPFRPLTAEEDREVVRRINDSEADIIWVGLGSPKQDRWMAEHLGLISAPVMVGVGAAFDFLTRRVSQAPGWMQRNGLEWLFRLIQEPKRLWRRYLIYNPLFVCYALLQLTGLRKFNRI